MKPTTKNKARNRTKVLVTIAMLGAFAFVVTAVIRIPVVLFLKYDPKDVIIAIGGLIYGPVAAAAIAVISAFIEMFTISETAWWGFLMNVIQSCSFACTAALIYKKRRDIKGAIIGLVSAWILTVGVMMLWNYIITPVYMGVTREAVVSLLVPAFLPFNVVKGGLNAAITILLYKPVVTALRKANLIETPQTLPKLNAETEPTSMPETKKPKLYIGVIIGAAIVIISCVLGVLAMQNII